MTAQQSPEGTPAAMTGPIAGATPANSQRFLTPMSPA